jgi:hypothetical protein
MDIRIRIKTGDFEIEYEGPKDFLKKELPDLIRTSKNLFGETPPAPKVEQVEEIPDVEEAPPLPEKKQLALTVTGVAKKLKCSSGQDLVLAACAKLCFVDQLDVFSRDEIREEMKRAKGYYKENYRKSLSNYFNALVKKGELLEMAKGTYSFSAAKKSEIEKDLLG